MLCSAYESKVIGKNVTHVLEGNLEIKAKRLEEESSRLTVIYL